jgi:hypothetical protein
VSCARPLDLHVGRKELLASDCASHEPRAVGGIGGLPSLREERDQLPARGELRHRFVWRPRLEPARRIEHLREQRHVACGVQEHPRLTEHPMHGEVDVGLLAKRLVPSGRGPAPAARASSLFRHAPPLDPRATSRGCGFADTLRRVRLISQWELDGAYVGRCGDLVEGVI